MDGMTRQTRSLAEYLEQIEQKKLLELLECEKQFRANPLPKYLYKKQMEHNDPKERSFDSIYMQHNKLNELIQSSNIKFDNNQPKIKNNASKESNKNWLKGIKDKNIRYETAKNSKKNVKKNTKNDYKECIIYDKNKFPVDSEVRNIIEKVVDRPRRRSLSGHRRRSLSGNVRQVNCPSEFNDPTFTPKINKYIPDFDHQYKNFLRKSALTGLNKSSTVCKPFNLHPPTPSSVYREDSYINFSNNNNNRRMSTSNLVGFTDAFPPRMTQSALLRCEHIKNKKSEELESKEKTERFEQIKRLKDKDLAKIIKEKAYVSDINSQLKIKLHSHRQSNRDKELNYLKEIKMMKEKLKDRPLLLQQFTKKNVTSTTKIKENYNGGIESFQKQTDNDILKSTGLNSSKLDNSKNEDSIKSNISNQQKVISKNLSRSTSKDSDKLNKNEINSDKESDSEDLSSEKSKSLQEEINITRNSRRTSNKSNLSQNISKKLSVDICSTQSKKGSILNTDQISPENSENENGSRSSSSSFDKSKSMTKDTFNVSLRRSSNED